MGVHSTDNENTGVSDADSSIIMTSLLDTLKRLLPRETQNDYEHARGRVAVASSMETSLWNSRFGGTNDEKRQEILKKYRRLYRSGGILRTGLDAYTQFILCSGYTVSGDDQTLVDEVKDLLFDRRSSYDAVIQQAVTDAVCIGDGYCKLLYGQGMMSEIPIGLQYLPAEYIRIVADMTEKIFRYDLYNSEGTLTASIPPEEIMHICLCPDGSSRYGIGYIESAWDDIKADTDVAESTVAAIRRHGFGIWHAKVSSGSPDIPVQESDVTKVKEALKRISARSEIVTSANIEIVGLNETGQTNIGSYTDWSVTRLCTALGVPGELLGIRQGTTDATAVERIQNFYKKIGAYQNLLEVAVNTQFIDRVLMAKGHNAGEVWIEYNDPSPKDDALKAQYVASIAAMTPDDPFSVMSRRQIQEYLGIDQAEWEADETQAVADEEETYEQNNPFTLVP